jgi:hypothetical protein
MMTDRELIYLIRTENKNLFKIFYERYKKILIHQIQNVIRKFYNCPLQFEDMNHFPYENCWFIVKKFNLKQNKYSVIQSICTVNKSKLYLYLKKLFRKGEALNHSISLEKIPLCNLNEHSYDFEKDFSNEHYHNDIVKLVINYAKENDDVMYKIIKYRLQGLNETEIKKIVRLNGKAFTRKCFYFFQKFRSRHLTSLKHI